MNFEKNFLKNSRFNGFRKIFKKKKKFVLMYFEKIFLKINMFRLYTKNSCFEKIFFRKSSFDGL